MTGEKTWVGYFNENGQLPFVKTGVLGANGMEKTAMSALPETSVKMIDHWYAKNYVPWHDLRIIFGRYKHLGA